eukprot:TRINITY_DN66960_c1_g1_i2.p1 TRINITY_DN66960_c1_g1~~TRINITY_DN66960_c1_g1_i2.p1  ORF type:complete len:268 (+),score=4.31 TRINITY_DN66960_c1_g1_i2:796-1599(+)
MPKAKAGCTILLWDEQYSTLSCMNAPSCVTITTPQWWVWRKQGGKGNPPPATQIIADPSQKRPVCFVVCNAPSLTLSGLHFVGSLSFSRAKQTYAVDCLGSEVRFLDNIFEACQPLWISGFSAPYADQSPLSGLLSCCRRTNRKQSIAKVLAESDDEAEEQNMDVVMTRSWINEHNKFTAPSFSRLVLALSLPSYWKYIGFVLAVAVMIVCTFVTVLLDMQSQRTANVSIVAVWSHFGLSWLGWMCLEVVKSFLFGLMVRSQKPRGN